MDLTGIEQERHVVLRETVVTLFLLFQLHVFKCLPLIIFCVPPMPECSFRGRIAEWRGQLRSIADQPHPKYSFL